jgi:hypothetical protein
MAQSERASLLDDLIQLPRFDSNGAVALGDQMLLVASAVAELPRPIERAREALAEGLEALRAAILARTAAAGAKDPAVLAESDRGLDECWSALFDWLTGYSRLPSGTPQAVEARALLVELYPDGLSFIHLPYELEWSQSDLRLSRLGREPLGDRLRALGGGVFIEALLAAHASYGKLLALPRASIPPGKDTSAAPPTVVEALETFSSTLRAYALKVTAHVEVEDPRTAVLAKALLEPLISWKGMPRMVGGELTVY